MLSIDFSPLKNHNEKYEMYILSLYKRLKLPKEKKLSCVCLIWCASKLD